MSPQSEEAFLAAYDIHDYPVPLTSVDVVIFTIKDARLQVLLVRRTEHPFMHQWALPGGFVLLEQDVTLAHTAARKLYDKTQVESPYLEQLQTIGDRDRDPRGWSVGKKRLGSNRPAQLYQVKDPSYTHFFARNIIGKNPQK